MKVNIKTNSPNYGNKYLDINKAKILIKAFLESQRKYFPLTWIFCSRPTTNRISQLRERALRLVDNGHVLSFNELLEKDGSFTVHQYSIQTFLIEMFKVCSGLSATTFTNSFIRQESSLNFCRNREFPIPGANTV